MTVCHDTQAFNDLALASPAAESLCFDPTGELKVALSIAQACDSTNNSEEALLAQNFGQAQDTVLKLRKKHSLPDDGRVLPVLSTIGLIVGPRSNFLFADHEISFSRLKLQ